MRGGKKQHVRGRSGTPCAILRVANHSLHHGCYTRYVIGNYYKVCAYELPELHLKDTKILSEIL